DQWKGSATELKEALNSPLTARALSQKLKKIQPVCVTQTRTKHKKTIHLHSSSFVAQTPKPLVGRVPDPAPDPQPTPSSALSAPSKSGRIFQISVMRNIALAAV